MESIFKHNGKIYRIDGTDPKYPDQFWGEQLEWEDFAEEFKPNERYELFKISSLIECQAEGLKLALKQTVEED
jgi:hypothetical protein